MSTALAGEQRTVEGGCLCRSIRYRVAGAPTSSIVCHCHTCRKWNAAPSVGWLTFERENFEILSGSPRAFSSSPGVVRKFCGDCGTPLTYESADEPDVIDVTTVSLDDPSLFPPTQEDWLEHRLPWQPTNEAIDQYRHGTGDGRTADD